VSSTTSDRTKATPAPALPRTARRRGRRSIARRILTGCETPTAARCASDASSSAASARSPGRTAQWRTRRSVSAAIAGEAFCPHDAITIRPSPQYFRAHPLWTEAHRKNLWIQAETGGVLLTGMGNDLPYPILWDHLLLDACQVTQSLHRSVCGSRMGTAHLTWGASRIGWR